MMGYRNPSNFVYFTNLNYFTLIRILILILILALTGSMLVVRADEIRVCRLSCPFHSLTDALRAAEEGATIRVSEGYYPEGVITIEKGVSIIGDNHPIIDGLKKGHVFYIRSDNVHLSGLTIQNSGRSYISDFAGIRAEQARNCYFDNNILKENTYAIYLEKVLNCTIKDNKISASNRDEISAGNGIHLFYSNQIAVTGNEIKGQRDGLYFEFTEDSHIEQNFSHENLRFGMHFMFSHRNTFNNNIYARNPTGVAIMYSHHLMVRRNIFSENKGASAYGILVKEITDSTFEENTFAKNTLAVMLNGSNRNTFKRNSFSLNGWAAEIYSNSYDNTFLENNFISNHFDFSTNSSRNSNTLAKNYWSQYKGYDFDRDGYGDGAYKPVSIFSFWVARYPELTIMLNSPIVSFLDAAERSFPVLVPKSLEDATPSMRPLPLDFLDADEEIAKFF